MPRLASASVLVFVCVISGWAQSSNPVPVSTLLATYDFATRDGPGVDWLTSQAATLALSSRWGQGLSLQGQLKASFDGLPVQADALVQQMVLTWNSTDWSILTLGKQRLKWGTARVFSAIDGLEPVADPLHPTAALDGVTGLKWEIIPSDWFSLSLLGLPAPKLLDSKTAVRADVLWEEADLSAGVVRSGSGAGQTVTYYADGARFFDRYGIYGEVQLKTVGDRQPQVRSTAGFQVDFAVWLNGTITWLNEYHYNGAGKQSGSGVGSYSYHYAYSGFSGVPLAEKIQWSASTLLGLDTGFSLSRTAVTYEVNQNLAVWLEYSRLATLRSDTASELDGIGWRQQVALSVSETF